ncbi:hypothetical protein M8J75_007856 [Diaphorina citri]|nr:hypothetical protein M8J75_007856 [Diaphorina citri]
MGYHVRKHTGEKPYKCVIIDSCIHCNEKLSTETDYLLDHGKLCPLSDRLNENSRRKVLVCYACDYRAHDSSRMRIHIRKHNGERPFKCSYCHYCAARSEHLNRHIQIKHSGALLEPPPYALTLAHIAQYQEQVANKINKDLS